MLGRPGNPQNIHLVLQVFELALALATSDLKLATHRLMLFADFSLEPGLLSSPVLHKIDFRVILQLSLIQAVVSEFIPSVAAYLLLLFVSYAFKQEYFEQWVEFASLLACILLLSCFLPWLLIFGLPSSSEIIVWHILLFLQRINRRRYRFTIGIQFHFSRGLRCSPNLLVLRLGLFWRLFGFLGLVVVPRRIYLRKSDRINPLLVFLLLDFRHMVAQKLQLVRVIVLQLNLRSIDLFVHGPCFHFVWPQSLLHSGQDELLVDNIDGEQLFLDQYLLDLGMQVCGGLLP